MSTFSAGLYDYTTGEEIVGQSPATGGTVDLAASESTAYVVKITLASEPGDYALSDDGTGGLGGPVTVPSNVMTVEQVNGDDDSLLEVAED
ncbi:MAG: hypothetical protein JRJ69_00815, partial [Deltaproteobacteria bacterium]|nr:hypothetical protein [Deltaproteobacteria bacterium]